MWNRIPNNIRQAFVEFVLVNEDLTPRELAVKYTNEEQYFVSENPRPIVPSKPKT